MNNVNKLILGTVQFGLNYGINNISGKVQPENVSSMLEFAHNSGIKFLDTSYAYGESELVLGNCLSQNPLKFNIVSKYPQCDKTVNQIFEETLSRLKTTHLYGYLVHHFNFYLENPLIWEQFKALKENGRVDKIGFSLYSTVELDYLFNHNVEFDLIQIPYNILDKQFAPYLSELHQRNIEVHTRSTFLQGLLYKDPQTLSTTLLPLKPSLNLLHSYCDNNNLTIEQLALNWVLNQTDIDGVLIGVDNISQLNNNIKTADRSIKQVDIDFIESIHVKEKELLNPVNWK